MNLFSVSALTLIALAATAIAQPRPGPTVDWSEVDARIAWFGTLDGARDAAKRTDRPILLVAAAPHCHHVPGVW